MSIGLSLSRRFFDDVVAPMLASRMPRRALPVMRAAIEAWD